MIGRDEVTDAGRGRLGALRRFRPGGLAKSALVVFAWNAARLASQMVWVVLLARALGADGYGVFSGTAGLALVMSGLVGAGLGLRMYQDVACERAEFPRRWAQAARALAWSAALLVCVFALVARGVFPQVPWPLLLAVALSEIVFVPMVTQAAFAYAAHGRMSRAAAVPVVLSLARLAAVLVLALWAPRQALIAYAWLHLVSTALVVAAIWTVCRNDLVKSQGDASLSWHDVRAGVGYSSVWASGQALGSLDKAVALRLGGAALAGNYTAAQRLATLVALPVDALITAVMPRLFRAGARQATHPRLVSWLSLATALYGILAGCALWWGARWVPVLLGAEFDPAVPALRVLSLYVPIYCLRSLGGNILLGFDWKRWRFGSEITAMVLMAVLMARWIPDEGVVGGAWSLLVAETFLAALVWMRIGIGRRTLAKAVE